VRWLCPAAWYAPAPARRCSVIRGQVRH